MNESVRRVEIFLGPVACSCSGMPSPAKLEKIEKALNDATPSIAVDGKITWIRDCPETADFLDRFGTTAKNKQSLGLRR